MGELLHLKTKKPNVNDLDVELLSLVTMMPEGTRKKFFESCKLMANSDIEVEDAVKETGFLDALLEDKRQGRI